MFYYYRAEKEALEAKKREERFLWKKTAVLAAAIIAGLHILSGKKVFDCRFETD